MEDEKYMGIESESHSRPCDITLYDELLEPSGNITSEAADIKTQEK